MASWIQGSGIGPGATGRQLRQRPRPMLTSTRLLDFSRSANFVASSRASWVNCFLIAFNFKTAALEYGLDSAVSIPLIMPLRVLIRASRVRRSLSICSRIMDFIAR